MAKAIVVLSGRLGQDPEDISEGKGVVVSVACDSNVKDTPSWYRVAIWDAEQKEFVKKYFKKGYSILVTGTMATTKVAEGKGVYVNITATNIQFGPSLPKKESEKSEDDIPF